jgi:hypothetical protein
MRHGIGQRIDDDLVLLESDAATKLAKGLRAALDQRTRPRLSNWVMD